MVLILYMVFLGMLLRLLRNFIRAAIRDNGAPGGLIVQDGMVLAETKENEILVEYKIISLPFGIISTSIVLF